MSATRAWLYVRGAESVRIVLEGRTVTIFGPGTRVADAQFAEEVEALLHQSALEQDLVRDGWSLEQLTTERRSGTDRRSRTGRGTDRRGALRLVRSRTEDET